MIFIIIIEYCAHVIYILFVIIINEDNSSEIRCNKVRSRCSESCATNWHAGSSNVCTFSTFNSSPSCVLQEYLAQKRERLQKKIKEHLLSELQRAELGSKGSGDLSEIVSSFSGMLKERGGGMDRNVSLVLDYA